jgi:hypothetical protein
VMGNGGRRTYLHLGIALAVDKVEGARGQRVRLVRDCSGSTVITVRWGWRLTTVWSERVRHAWGPTVAVDRALDNPFPIMQHIFQNSNLLRLEKYKMIL